MDLLRQGDVDGHVHVGHGGQELDQASVGLLVQRLASSLVGLGLGLLEEAEQLAVIQPQLA